MLSECARVTTSAENRFRISAPNSRPRAVTVVALDDASEQVVQQLARQSWGNTVFRTASAAGIRYEDGEGSEATGWLRDLEGHPVDLTDEIDRAHLIVMVATAGADVSAAEVIGDLCRWSGVTTTTLVLVDLQMESMSMTLLQLRPLSTMLVITSSTDCLADMLVALRA